MAVGFGLRDEEDAILVRQSEGVDLILQLCWKLHEWKDLAFGECLDRDGSAVLGFFFLQVDN